ncbi:predicted protein [Naegleria gruberi]|uniref:Predicted protein n=1 Tax=Naegleria gruberi TaxID=5762 RepID=D2VQN8_NAEGR|nr:uncharacterized protein NAEGRDRAFT_71293 [Naegleria gruberi]EFC40903.1 predicted protein [Naegleria gruberi]|eukprot:XP_002673647.1 predicted protein [Naegleria gruberi strain NEG-M]
MIPLGKTLLIGTASSLLGAVCLDYVLSKHYFKIETIREDTNREQVMKTYASLKIPSLNMQEVSLNDKLENVSMLDRFESKYGEEIMLMDHYRTSISIPKSGESMSQLNSTEMAQSFYSSPLFGLEKMILARIEPTFGNLENSKIEKMNFDIGENVSIFHVIEKKDDEILLRTPWGSLSWMKVVRKSDSEYELNFGSGILTKGHLGSKPMFKVLIPFHAIYSRYLLAFTKRGIAINKKL